MSSFQALVVREKDGAFVRSVEGRQVDELPEGEVLIRVWYSSLNYKDALSAVGNKGVTKVYPHTPGIDAVGEVVESSIGDFGVGDRVLVTGYDLGMNTAGGFGQMIRVPAAWVVRLPEGLELRESMGYGTAGFTAALSVHRLMAAGVREGEVLVTGATGGVGCLAVALLASVGFDVVAATGKASEEDFLKGLGAVDVVGRGEVDDASGRPMLSERWAGVVDTVGGNMLATALKATRYGGAVTCCGLVASPKLEMTVFPFILRGVQLIGIDSVLCPMDLRVQIWDRLAGDWAVEGLDEVMVDCGLDDLEGQIDQMLKGQSRGRVVVDLNQ